MKVIAKEMAIVSVEICLAALSLVFLFRVFGPHEEKLTMWLPDNYQLMNKINSEAEIIVPQQTEDNESCLGVTMPQFKKIFGKCEYKTEISIICDKSGRNYDIIYQITCQAPDKNNFIIKSTNSHNHDYGSKHFLKAVKLDQKTGALLIKCDKNWPLIIIIFIPTFVVIFVVSSICGDFLCFRHK